MMMAKRMDEMYKVLSAFAMSGLIFAASGASAQSFPGTGPWTMSTDSSTGELNLYQTVPDVSCNASFSVVASGSNYSVTGGSFSPGVGFCGPNIFPFSFSWDLNISGTVATIVGAKVDAVYGICEGNLVGTYDSGNQTVTLAPGTFIPGYLKASPSTSIPCFVDGVLHVK